MTKKQLFFKKLLDIAMFISYSFMIVFLILAIYGVMIDALQFADTTRPFIDDEHSYLRPMYSTVIIILTLSVLLARVFLQFVLTDEKLESIEEYKKKSEKKKQPVSKNQTRLEVKDNIMLFDSTKYVPKKERERKEIPVIATPSVSVKEIKEKEKQFYTRLNKKELNGIISRVLNISDYKSRKFINGLLNVIKDELVLGNEVKIDNFGRFYTIDLEEREGVNPSTGEKITIKAHRVVKFKPYKKFKDDITNDVVATSERYLLTKPTLDKLDETEVSQELEKEKLAEEHIETTVTKPAYFKAKKKIVPKKTKKDIIEIISSTTDISKNKANKFLNGLLEVVSEEIGKKQDVDIKDFGKFTTIHIPEKVAVNPQTNERIVVQEHDQIKLRFSKTFKDIFK